MNIGLVNIVIGERPARAGHPVQRLELPLTMNNADFEQGYQMALRSSPGPMDAASIIDLFRVFTESDNVPVSEKDLAFLAGNVCGKLFQLA